MADTPYRGGKVKPVPEFIGFEEPDNPEKTRGIDVADKTQTPTRAGVWPRFPARPGNIRRVPWLAWRTQQREVGR
jgi:hypothetical protein